MVYKAVKLYNEMKAMHKLTKKSMPSKVLQEGFKKFSWGTTNKREHAYRRVLFDSVAVLQNIAAVPPE